MPKHGFLKITPISAALMVGLAAPVYATPRTDSHNGLAPVGAVSDSAFSSAERKIICEYYKITSCSVTGYFGAGADNGHKPGKKIKGDIGSGDKTALLPPGLAGRDELPSGLERQYQLKGSLPPGLQRRQLPDDLARVLPVRGSDFDRVIVGNDILLLRRATGIVLDIMEDAASGK